MLIVSYDDVFHAGQYPGATAALLYQEILTEYLCTIFSTFRRKFLPFCVPECRVNSARRFIGVEHQVRIR